MALDWRTEYSRYQKYFVKFGSFYQRKKARTYTGVVFSIFTVIFFLYFAIKPTLVTITGLFKEIQDQRQVAEKLQDKINSLNQAQMEYSLIENDLYLVDQALPTDPQVSSLVKEIEALARQSGVSLEGFRVDKTQLKGESSLGTTSQINLNINVNGEYKNLKDFLNSLSSLRRVILVKSFSFKSAKTESQTLTLGLGLAADAHYLKPMGGQQTTPTETE